MNDLVRVPRPDRRGRALIPTSWALLAGRAVDEHTPDHVRRDCAMTLAELVHAASERVGPQIGEERAADG